MSDAVKCPVCLNVHGGDCHMWLTHRDSSGFDCKMCGRFELSNTVYSGALDPEHASLTPLQRAALSHRLREASQQTDTTPLVTSDWLKRFLENPRLPSPAIQALNAIRFIGDRVSVTGEKVPNLQPYFCALIGASNPTMAGELVLELKNRGLIDGIVIETISAPPDLLGVNLTLSGWGQYESEKQGKIGGHYGFLAMKFGDALLDHFVRTVVKPCIKNGIGYDLFDIRDFARAGIIDNIMRAQIRDSAFVIVDLTHDNSGAYWEAGYAEGLSKPVIYICEKTKFEDAKTHFDTNHCTTVLWLEDDTETFKNQLVATLRRSLNLFPTK